MYLVNGKLVDAQGQPLEAQVEPEQAEVGGITLLGEAQAALRTVVNAQQQIAELFPEKFGPGDVLTSEDGTHPLVEAVKALLAERDDLNQRLDTMTGYRDAAAYDANDFRPKLEQAQQQVQQLTEQAQSQERALADRVAELDKAKTDWAAERASFEQHISDLQGQLTAQASPPSDPDEQAPAGDADQRNKTALKAALDAAGISYDPKANHAALLALATEHKV